MEVTDELMLTWSNHQPTLLQEVATLRHKGGYADVTLACEGQLYCAHKFVLAMCSDYFRNIFNSSSVSSTSSNLVIVLKDVPCLAVEQLLDFMYTGEVAVDRACLPALIKTAENLQIRGLALPDHLPDTSFREAAKLPAQTGRHTPADKTKVSHREAGLYSDDSILSRSLEGYDTRGEHIHDGRANRNNSRLPVSSREGTSPPSKRKRLLDYSQSSAASADTPSPVGTPRKSSVSSPGLGFPALSSPVPSSLVSGGAALPTPPSHSSPLTVPSSKLCVQQAAAGRMDTSSPRFPQSRSEPTTPVTQAAPLPSSPLNFRAGQCLAPSSQALPCLDHSSTSGHCVLPSATLAASSGTGLPLPEDVEIKREADDTTVCDLRNSSIDPSRDGAELKEEPPGDEMDVGSSEMRADDEGWLGASVADGAGSLIADASEDDAAAHSDSDVAGDKLGISSSADDGFKDEPRAQSPALFSPGLAAASVSSPTAVFAAAPQADAPRSPLIALSSAVTEAFVLGNEQDKDANLPQKLGKLEDSSAASTSCENTAVRSHLTLSDASRQMECTAKEEGNVIVERKMSLKVDVMQGDLKVTNPASNALTAIFEPSTATPTQPCVESFSRPKNRIPPSESDESKNLHGVCIPTSTQECQADVDLIGDLGPLSEATTVLYEDLSDKKSPDSNNLVNETPSTDQKINSKSSTVLEEIMRDPSGNERNGEGNLIDPGHVLNDDSARMNLQYIFCEFCGYKTVSKTQLESHARELHPEQFSRILRSCQNVEPEDTQLQTKSGQPRDDGIALTKIVASISDIHLDTNLASGDHRNQRPNSSKSERMAFRAVAQNFFQEEASGASNYAPDKEKWTSYAPRTFLESHPERSNCISMASGVLPNFPSKSISLSSTMGSIQGPVPTEFETTSITDSIVLSQRFSHCQVACSPNTDPHSQFTKQSTQFVNRESSHVSSSFSQALKPQQFTYTLNLPNALFRAPNIDASVLNPAVAVVVPSVHEVTPSPSSALPRSQFPSVLRAPPSPFSLATSSSCLLETPGAVFIPSSQPPRAQAISNFASPPPLRTASNTPSHLRIVPESEKKFTCPYCYMVLYGRQVLFDHVAYHSKNDPSCHRKIWCPYCTLKFHSMQQLIAHFKTHSAEEIG